METTMKLGLIIKQGNEKEVTREFNGLLEKAKEGYKDLVCVSNNKSFKNEYAIYQIIN